MRIFAKDTEPTHLPTTTGHSFVMLITTLLLVSTTFGPALIQATSQLWDASTPSTSTSPIDAAKDGLALIIFSFVASFLIYACHPLWKRRSFGPATTLDPSSTLARIITERAEQAGIAQPKMLVDNDIRNTEAITFGIGNQKTILMGRGLLRLAHIKPQSIDARICHEIGHIYNRDVSKKYFGEAAIFTIILMLFYSLVIFWMRAIQVFYLSTQIDRNNGVAIVDILFHWKKFFFEIGYRSTLMILKAMLIGVLLMAIHRLFIRSREYYADRVSAVFSSGTQLIYIFSRANSSLKHGRAYSYHPSPETRSRFLNNVGLFYTASIPSVFLTGFIAGTHIYLAVTSPTAKYFENFEDFGSYTKYSLTHVDGFFLFIVTSLQFSSTLIILIALLFHLSNNLLLSDNRKCAAAHTFVVFIVFYFSMVMGAHYNPFIFEARLQNNMNPFTTYPSNVYEMVFQNIAILGAIGTIFLIPILKRLYSSTSQTKPSRVRWLFIAIFFGQSVNYAMYTSTLLLANFDKQDGQIDWIAMRVALVYGTTFYLLAYLLARRTVRIGLVPFNRVSPWMKSLEQGTSTQSATPP